MNTDRLRQIEGDLDDDALTDEEMTAALREAGLPQVARVLERAQSQVITHADLVREEAHNARVRMNDGTSADGYTPVTEHATAYNKGWQDALDSLARHLDRIANSPIRRDLLDRCSRVAWSRSCLKVSFPTAWPTALPGCPDRVGPEIISPVLASSGTNRGIVFTAGSP